MEQSIYLFCTEGGSDKEYHAHLLSQASGWAVQYANGPRDRVGQSKVKVEGLNYELAKKEYDKLVKSKKAGGYTEDESGVRFTNTENGGRASGHAQQLPSAIDENKASALNRDDRWAAQEKANGERRTVVVDASGVRGINKLGLYVNIPETWCAEFAAFGPAVMDGEQVGDTFHVFDLLEMQGKNIRERCFEYRYRWLVQLLNETRASGSAVPSINLLGAAFTFAEKLALAKEIADNRREGMVYKNVHASYGGGRSEDSLKYKLIESSTCIVIAQNRQRSVQIGLLDPAGELVPVGNVTIPANQAVPNEGDLVEIQYLYFNPGGAFEQPVYLGARNDIKREEALLTQIGRLKPGIEMHDDGTRVFERERG